MLNLWNSLGTYHLFSFVSSSLDAVAEFDRSTSSSLSSTTSSDIATIVTSTTVAAVAAGTTMFVDLALESLANSTSSTMAVDSYVANQHTSGTDSTTSSSTSSSGSSGASGSDANSGSSVVSISLKGSRFSLTQIIFLVMIAGTLSTITVVGNVMVMVSFKIDKQLQTISNYFLFSLAVADFAVGLISMPLFTVYTILGYWPLGPVICDIWLALDYLASNASVLNLLIISFDRYFSVTRPLTYRAKRSPTKAGIMILGAWGISLLLWPPWIYAWPYIEGKRTVPDDDCYIQFIQTNQYITFGTAIAAFYVPVTVMCILYWRIWRETEKRQKDLPNLQGGKQDNSKRSTSSEEQTIVDSDGWARVRSSSNVANCDMESSYLSRTYESQYSRQPKARPFTSAWVRQWCVAWWHSGREDYELDDYWEDTASEAGFGTPGSADTTLPSTVSRSTSLNPYTERGPQSRTMQQDVRTISNVNKLVTSRSASNDSIYTILIRLPSAECEAAGGEGPTIKMIPEIYSAKATVPGTSLPTIATASATATTTTIISGAVRNIGGVGGPGPPAPLSRRVSTMATSGGLESRTNIGTIGRVQSSRVQTISCAGGVKSLLPRQLPAVGVKKKKKKEEKRADTKAAKMLSAILLAFLITWTPYNILVLLKPITAFPEYIPKGLWDFFYYFCYINSTINPVVYALCNTTFRRTYVRILTCKWKSRHRMPINRAIYN